MKREVRPTVSSAVRSALVLVAALVIAIGAVRGASDVMAKLGVSQAEASQGMLDGLISGNAYNQAALSAFRALPAGLRAEIVRDALAWIKARTESAEFKAAYAQMRQDQKPSPPEPALSAEERIKRDKAEMEKSIAEAEKTMAGLDAQMKKALEGAIKELRNQVKELDKPERLALYRQAVEAEKAGAKTSYEEDMKRWEERTPEDPRVLVAKRIRQFLETSKDVDFSAKLVPAGSLMRFADARYEEKPREWKICFRAGREATEAARAFATKWLAELGK